MLGKRTFKTGIAAILALSAPAAVYAQAEDGATAGEITAESVAPVKEEDAILAMITKMFDTDANNTPINPAQLQLAETTADKLLPKGSLKSMMSRMFENIMTPIMNALPEMSSAEIMMKTGIYDGEIENLGEEKRKKITALLDPARKDRGKQTIDAITPMLNETMDLIEPPMRTGISRAYARKFSAAQLRQINGFFATPTGALYAAESYPLQADPEIMRAMFKAMPDLMEKLKTKAPTIETEMKKLPKERALSDLNNEEIASLAKLLNVEVAALEEQRVIMAAGEAASAAGDVAAADAAEASPNADETGEEPWHDQANWAKADRAKTDAAFKKRDKAEALSSAANSAWSEAFENAVGKSREKYRAEGWKPAPVVDTSAEDPTVEATAAEKAAQAAATETP